LIDWALALRTTVGLAAVLVFIALSARPSAHKAIKVQITNKSWKEIR